jgi:hypothetical protein
MNARIAGRFGAVALGTVALGFAGCGSNSKSGGSGDEGQIKSSIEKFVKEHDCAQATPAFAKELTGQTSVKACSHDLSLRNKVKKLSVDKVTTSGSTAKAVVDSDGQKVNIGLVKQGDKWLLSSSGT